eukprot:2997394-Rhodomonas_salina.3
MERLDSREKRGGVRGRGPRRGGGGGRRLLRRARGGGAAAAVLCALCKRAVVAVRCRGRRSSQRERGAIQPLCEWTRVMRRGFDKVRGERRAAGREEGRDLSGLERCGRFH